MGLRRWKAKTRRGLLGIASILAILPNLLAASDLELRKRCSLRFGSLEAQARLDRQKQILRAYRNAFKKSTSQVGVVEEACLYQNQRCQSNVIRLFDHMKAQIPNLEKSEFEVINISFKGGPNFDDADEYFPVLQGRLGYVKGERVKKVHWKYHVALKYGDFILDLDNTDRPRAYPFKTYVKKLFDPSERRYLYYYTVPGDVYLSTPADQANKKVFHFKIYRNYKGIRLDSVLDPDHRP